MAAPDFVPTVPTDQVRTYSSPPRGQGSWTADRPGDLTGAQPRGAGMGTMGPDQGYAYRLAHQFDDKLVLGAVNSEDAVAACVAVAIKRASLFGRGPIVHDLTAAFTIFGFLDDEPADDLVELRVGLFGELRNAHHYSELRHLVDLVPDEVLAQTPKIISTDYQTDWHSNLDLSGLDSSH